MSHLRTITLLVLVALLLPAFGAVCGPVAAQNGGGLSAEEQALVDRVRAAVLATEDYSAGVARTTATSTVDAVIALGDASYPGMTIIASDYEHHFTRDADGLPNSAVFSTFDVTEEDANGNVRSYRLDAEVRIVGSAVYVQAVRVSDDEVLLDPMPEGWLLVDDTTETAWPALDELPLADVLREIDLLGVVDPDVLIILDHASHAALDDPVTLDTGVEADVVNITVTGEALRTALMALSLQTSGEDLSAVYAQLSADGRWDMTFWLDEHDQIVQYDMAVTFDLIDVDLTLLAPSAPEGARFTQHQTFNIASLITVFDAPTEPVIAPAIGVPE